MEPRKQKRIANRFDSIPHDVHIPDSVFRQVVHDEQNAIHVLCSLLEYIQETRQTQGLSAIAVVMKGWPDCPPGVIVTSLRKIGEDLGWPTSKSE